MVKIKDVNAPKKPLTPYFAWQNQNRNRIKKSMHVNYSFEELSQAFSKEWKGLSAEEKQPFEETYKSEQETYKRLFTAYKLTANYKAFQTKKAEAKVADVKGAKFKKDPNAPKKPLTGYFLFLGAKRDTVKAQNPDLSHKAALKKLGAMWSEMSDSAKKEYNDKAALAKKEYLVELAKYKETEEYKSYTEEKTEWQTAKKTKLKLVRKRARTDPDGEFQPTKKRKKSKKSPKKSPKKSKKKSKKSKKSGKPKAPKKASKKSRKSLLPKKKSKKARKAVRKAKKSD